jgi:hypothetical protein
MVINLTDDEAKLFDNYWYLYKHHAAPFCLVEHIAKTFHEKELWAAITDGGNVAVAKKADGVRVDFYSALDTPDELWLPLYDKYFPGDNKEE